MAASSVDILALGDSLTAGYGIQAEQAFPARLQNALQSAGQTALVENAGVSGDTTAGGLARLDWVLNGRKPALVIVELGGNDGLRGLPPEQTEANLDAILTRLRKDGIPVLLAGMMAPPNLGKEYGQAFNAIYPRLAERHTVPLYPVFLEGAIGSPALMQRDGIHPNAAGVEVIVARILPFVTQALGDTP